MAPVLMAVLALLSGCAEDTGGPAAGSTGAGPEPAVAVADDQTPFEPELLVVRPPSRDLGVVGRDDVVWTTFEVHNGSARTVRILRVAGSCGCLGFHYDRVPLPPGSTQELKVKLTASKRAGQRLSVQVQWDAPGLPIDEVELRCFARPEPVFRPASVSFGRRPVGNDAVEDAVLTYPVPPDLAPAPETVTTVEEGPVTCSAGPPRRLGLAGTVHVEVPLEFRLDASRTGPVRARFRLESDLHEAAEILVLGWIHPGYYLEPDRLHLGRMAPGRTVQKTVRLMFTGDTAPAVTAEGSAPWITARALPAEAAFVPLLLEVTAPQPGAFAEELRVQVGEDEPLTLPLQGLVRQ